MNNIISINFNTSNETLDIHNVQTKECLFAGSPTDAEQWRIENGYRFVEGSHSYLEKQDG